VQNKRTSHESLSVAVLQHRPVQRICEGRKTRDWSSATNSSASMTSSYVSITK
jgi:hypothetical protein